MIKRALYHVLLVIVLAIIPFLVSGCDSLRFAPTEAQKDSCFLHAATSSAVSDMVNAAVDRGALAAAAGKLADNAQRQATVLQAYIGLPETLPDVSSIDALIDDNSTEQAQIDASKRPSVTDIADAASGGVDVLVGIATALAGVGVIGGSGKVMALAKKAKQTSTALNEVVAANSEYLTALSNNGKGHLVKIFKNIQSATQTGTTPAMVNAAKPAKKTAFNFISSIGSPVIET